MGQEGKMKALSREETKVLVSLIQQSHVINSKKTNAIQNRQKALEWERVTQAFNSKIADCPRTPHQLRLKWENLKKSSRKRNAIMKQIKAEDRTLKQSSSNEVLDQVAIILASNEEDIEVANYNDVEPSIDDDDGVEMLDTSVSMGIENTPSESDDSFEEECMELGGDVASLFLPSKKYRQSNGTKQNIFEPNDGQQARNIAMAKYFRSKKTLVETQLIKEKLEIKKLRLENEILKLNRVKLILEIRKIKGGM